MRFCVALFIALLSTVTAKSQQPPTPPQIETENLVLLTWNRNPEPDISHYVLHWGTNSSLYTLVTTGGDGNMVTNRINGGSNYTSRVTTTNLSVLLNNLDVGVVYYFAATAVNTAMLESAYSKEIEFQFSSRPSRPQELKGLNVGKIPVYELQVRFSDGPEGPWEEEKIVKLVIDTDKQYQFMTVSNRVTLADAVKIP